MSIHIVDPELLGVTETSLTMTLRIEDQDGNPVEGEARILLNGEERARTDASLGTQLIRIESIEAATTYRLEVQCAGAPPPEPTRYFPETVTTLPSPTALQSASFATLNDVHFGEQKIGGVLTADHEYGEEAPNFPVIRASDTEIPYPQFMNSDAVKDINRLGVDNVIIKGDIADRGLPKQFEDARITFDDFKIPYHAFLGNHDYLAQAKGEDVDGYALLGQPAAPRVVELGGWRLILLETSEPGEHYGVFGGDRIAWLDRQLLESAERDSPTLLLMHHHPVPPERADGFPNRIGIKPEDSTQLFKTVGNCAQVKGVLIGHTHRNRVRQYSASGSIPWAEVANSKDYPGAFAHYRLFEDGSFRQEVRRIGSERALAHSTLCSGLFNGMYRHFALGPLEARSFVAP